MTSIGVLVLGLVVMMAGKVEMARLQPGGTHQFDYDSYRYWAKIDWWGSVNFYDAWSDCENLYGAEVVTITGDKQYGSIQSEVADIIPEGWSEVILWTNDNETAHTYQMLVIWSSASNGTDGKVSFLPSYRGHGYICQRNLSMTTLISTTTTTTSTQPTTTATEDTTVPVSSTATTVPLSSTSSTPPQTATTDGRTRPAPQRGSCSEEYIATLKEYKEILAEYQESFDKWKNSVNL